jgi:hypothetical protein
LFQFALNFNQLYKFVFSTGLQRLDIIGASPRALDVVNLLDSHVVLLPGGRDPNGHPLITFPNIGSLREKVGREDYKKVLHYLASITRLVDHICCRNVTLKNK